MLEINGSFLMVLLQVFLAGYVGKNFLVHRAVAGQFTALAAQDNDSFIFLLNGIFT